MILKFRVEGQTLFPLPTNDIPREGSRDYLKVDFDFGCGTEAYTKTVYFTSEAEGEEAPFSTAVVYEGEPIRVDDYFAQKSFAISVGFVLGERSYTTNEVSVPLDPASDVWLNLPKKPGIPAYQQLVNLAENAAASADSAAKNAADASASADSAAKDAEEASSAAYAALQAVKASGYVDVTEAYRSNAEYRDQPEEYLRSLGPGKWLIDDEWALYRMEIFDLDGQEWRIEQSWTDDGIYTMRMVNEGREIVNFDSGVEELRVNGSVIAPSGDNSSGDNSSGDGTCDIPMSAVAPLDIQGANWLNWFDYSDHINNYEAGKGIDSVDGSEYELAGQYLFPKIPLRGGKTYTMSGSMRVCVLYNAADDSYISTLSKYATTNPITFTVSAKYPEVYIRFCHNNTTYIKDTFMIVEGEILPDSFVPHEAVVAWLSIADKSIDGTQLVDGSVDGEKLKIESVDGNRLKNRSVPVDKFAAFCGSANLYNSALADKSLWHDSAGTHASSLQGYFASPLISVTPGRKYYVYGVMEAATKSSVYAIQTVYSAYEVNFEGIYSKITFENDPNSGKAIVYTASENAKYLAFNARDSYIDKFVVSEKFHAYCPPYIAQLANTQNVVQGHYAGGTLVALGDSITRGCSNGETLEDGTVLANGGQIPQPYANYAAELLGMYCKNFGVDGATVKTVLERINSTDYMAGLKAQPDIITVKIGTNDMAQVPLGTIDDVYDAANVSYYGGLKEIARLLSEGFPTSAVVFITPLRANDNAREYVKAIEEVAELYDIPCMQMHKVLRYMQQDSNGSYYINDYYNGLHPNQAAHLRMGRALAGFLQTV